MVLLGSSGTTLASDIYKVSNLAAGLTVPFQVQSLNNRGAARVSIVAFLDTGRFGRSRWICNSHTRK